MSRAIQKARDFTADFENLFKAKRVGKWLNKYV